MEKMIGFDFQFTEFSKIYGEFIVDALTSYPEGKIENVTHFHSISHGNIVVYFSCPENTAVFLKLKYGGHIVSRPESMKEDSIEEFFRKYSKKKESYYKKKWIYNDEDAFRTYLKKFYDSNYE